MRTIKAKKSLGQNFLIDQEALVDIASALVVRDAHIIEVGPGYGALTEYLVAEHPSSLDLVELDPDMITLLEERIQSGEWASAPIDIHHQDVLQYIVPHQTYSVIANIPYYITSPILFHFLYPEIATKFEISQKQEVRETNIFSKGIDGCVSVPQGDFQCSEAAKGHGEQNFCDEEIRSFSEISVMNPPEEMVIMMQSEVGEKILEGRHPKKPHHSFLSLCMEQACDDIRIVRYVGRESFDPAPRVDSIVLYFALSKNRDRIQEQRLISLWKVAFAHPRKTLLSNLKGSLYSHEMIRTRLIELGYSEQVRSEAIRYKDWQKLLIP